jgi:hypothetical protein
MISIKCMFTAILVMVFSSSAFAFVSFNVHLIHKRGVDEGLVLVSELHSKETLFDERPVRLVMNDGTSLQFSISSLDFKDMTLRGEVVFPDGVRGGLKGKSIQLGKKYTFNIKGKEGEVIEFVIIPTEEIIE